MFPLLSIGLLNGVVEYGLQKSLQNHHKEMAATVCSTVTIWGGIISGTVVICKVIDAYKEHKEHKEHKESK